MAQASTTSFPPAAEKTDEAVAAVKTEDWRTSLKIPPKDTRVKTEVSADCSFKGQARCLSRMSQRPRVTTSRTTS